MALGIVDEDVDAPADGVPGSLTVAVTAGDVIIVTWTNADDGSGAAAATVADGDLNIYGDDDQLQSIGSAPAGGAYRTIAGSSNAALTITVTMSNEGAGLAQCSVKVISDAGTITGTDSASDYGGVTSLTIPATQIACSTAGSLVLVYTATQAISREWDGITNAAPPSWLNTPTSLSETIILQGNDGDSTTWTRGWVWGTLGADGQVTFEEDAGDSTRAIGWMWIFPPAGGGGITEAVGQAVEQDVAGAISALKTIAVGQATEDDAPGALAVSKSIGIAQAAEQDLASAFTYTRARAVAQATEQDVANPMVAGSLVQVGQASEQDLANATAAAKAKALAQATEQDVATATGAAKAVTIGQAVEQDIANAVSTLKALLVGLATEDDVAQLVSSGSITGVGQATETDVAPGVAYFRALGVGQATEQDLAGATQPRKTVAIGQATETDSAGAVSPRRAFLIGQATEQDAATALSWARFLAIGQAIETDSAIAIVLVGGATAVVTIGAFAAEHAAALAAMEDVEEIDFDAIRADALDALEGILDV